jgi:hypothetical protein
MNDIMKPYQVKQLLINLQLDALHCDKYRITLMPRRDGLFPRNYGNHQKKEIREKKGISERFWTTREILGEVKELEIQNLKGYEIYVTPISEVHHHFVVDDLTQESLNRMLTAGYKPALIQESSEMFGRKNFQAVLILHKQDNHHEQSIANFLFVNINKEYGDKNITSVTHAFRLAGFANKKIGKNDFFTNVISATGSLCAKAEIELCELRKNYVEKPKDSKTSKVQSAVLKPLVVLPDEVALQAFKTHWKIEEKKVIEKGWTIDRSKLDWRVAKNLRGMGFSDEQISSAILYGSPDIEKRHPRTEQYILDVVERSKLV